MPRFIAFAVSFFWMSVFVLLAMTASGMIATANVGAAAAIFTGIEAPLFTVGFLLVATAFLWAFVAVIFDNGSVPGDIDWIVRVATASGMLVTTFALLTLAPQKPLEALAGGLLMIIALSASASAVDAECRTTKRKSVEDNIDVVAGRMAVGAAHTTMLSAISRRGPGGQGEH